MGTKMRNEHGWVIREPVCKYNSNTEYEINTDFHLYKIFTLLEMNNSDLKKVKKN